MLFLSSASAFSFSFCNSLSTTRTYMCVCVCVITSLVQTLNCSDCHYQRGRTQMYVYMCVDQLGRRQGFRQWRRGGSYLGVHYVCCTNGLFIFAARVTFLLLQLLLPLVLSLLFLFLLYTTNVRALPKCYFNWGEPSKASRSTAARQPLILLLTAFCFRQLSVYTYV